MEQLYAVGGRYLVTDYTSFESLFTKDLMDSCELVLYKYMVSALPDRDQFIADCEEVIAGRNHCKFDGFNVDLDATRMSGEMCTSLGNGFSNLMFMSYLCHKRGWKCKMIVEGDDGVTRIDGPPPTIADFAALGLRIKLEEVPSLEEASFCGLIFDPIDCINVTNPVNAMLKFGWASRQYVRAGDRILQKMLRCKALSMLYEYGGCPILGALADYSLRMTDRQPIKQGLRNFIGRMKTDSWSRDKLVEAYDSHPKRREPGIATRLLVENRYGISVESQLKMERYFDTCTELKPIPMELVGDYVRPLWQDMWREYAYRVPKGNVGVHDGMPYWGPRADCPRVLPV